MFAKATFLLFALVAFVNAAPINFTVRPLNPLIFPGGGKAQPLASKRDLAWGTVSQGQGVSGGVGGVTQGHGVSGGMGQGFGGGIQRRDDNVQGQEQDNSGDNYQGQGQGQGYDLDSLTFALSQLSKRADFPYELIGANAHLPFPFRKRDGFPPGSIIGGGHGLPFPFRKRELWGEFMDRLRAIGLTVNKRDTVDLDTLGSQILGGLKSNGLDQYVEHFSTRIQRLKDLLADNVSQEHVKAEAENLLLEYRQVLSGLNVNKPVEARDIVIDSQTLSQLQNFVVSTANLLRVLRGSDAVNTFLSKINELKVEAQNGSLDAEDLLRAARDIVSSII